MATAPTADTIAAAADSLGTLSDFVRQAQLRELESFGDAGLQALGASGISTDVKIAYELGLQTGREQLAAVAADVSY